LYGLPAEICGEKANADTGGREAMNPTLEEIRDALVTLGIDGDKLFQSIREDLLAGYSRGARERLRFVDLIVATKQTPEDAKP